MGQLYFASKLTLGGIWCPKIGHKGPKSKIMKKSVFFRKKLITQKKCQNTKPTSNTCFICLLGTYMSNLDFKKFESSEKKTLVFALLNFDQSTSCPYLGPLEVPKTPNDLRTLKQRSQGFQNGIKHFFSPKNTRDISILRKKSDFQSFRVRFLENLKLSKNGVF